MGAYGVIVIAVIAGLFHFLYKKSEKDKWIWALRLFLVGYCSLLYSSTIIFRPIRETRRCELKPFWSYVSCIHDGTMIIPPEIIMNVLVFVPLGILSFYIFKKNIWLIIIVGFAISVSVEFLQFVFKKGIVEFDDVFHNTLGCLIGCFFAMMLSKIIEVINSYRIERI